VGGGSLCGMDQAQQRIMTHRHTQDPGDLCRLDTVGGEGDGPQCIIQSSRPMSMWPQPFEPFCKHFEFAKSIGTKPFTGFQIQMDRFALDG